LLLLDIVGKRPLPTNPLVASVRGRRKLWSRRRGLVCHWGLRRPARFHYASPTIEEYCWRVV